MTRKFKFCILYSVFCILSFNGCRSLRSDPNAELKAAGEIFAGTVNVLTELKAQGQLGDDEIAEIGKLIHLGEQYLQRWHAAVQAGEKDAEAVAAFQMVLEQLEQVRRRHYVDQ